MPKPLTVPFLCALLILAGSFAQAQIPQDVEKLFRSAPAAEETSSPADFPYIEFPAQNSYNIPELILAGNTSAYIYGSLEAGKLTVEESSISGIAISGSCLITGNAYLRDKAVLSIEGRLEIMGSLDTGNGAYIIMLAGSSLVVHGKISPEAKKNMVGSGRLIEIGKAEHR
jgi:hypothetical protein